MSYRARSYFPSAAKRRNPDVIADATPAVICRCRPQVHHADIARWPSSAACPRHAPNLYAMRDARHVLAGVRGVLT